MPKLVTPLSCTNIRSMNSSLDILLPGVEHQEADNIFDLIEKEASKLEKLLSCFDPKAETYQVNLKAKYKWVHVSDPLWRILMECIHYNQLTLGYFDIGLKFFKQNPSFIYQGVHPKIYGLNSIAISDENHSLRFLDETSSIDFGAVGKGLLLREVDKILSEFETENCFISFGGSSILTRGTHPYGTSWPVALRHFSGNQYVFHMNNHYASFSGAILKNSPGEGYHIVHPKRLELIQSSRITFIQSDCPVLAEVLSTSLIAADDEDIPKIISKAKPLEAHVFDKDSCLNENYEGVWSFRADS